jgi:polysaccharide export outer membrane protein
MKIRNLLLLAVAATLFVACTTEKEIPYLTNIDDIPAAALAAVTTQAGDFTIKPGDMLQISVSASNADAVKPFNKIQYVINTMGAGSGGYTMIGDNSTVFYLVDDNGNIDFPVLGKLHVSGMTKKSIEEYVASLIYPRYLTEMPSVDCRIQNFRVYCLGEFNKTGVVSATNGRLNLIEAIALSGDLTLQGRRDNILLIRTDGTGQRIVKRFNLQDAKIMAIPEFELQQNDILYVQPSVYKARSAWSMPPIYSTAVGMMGTAMSLITFITVLAKK